MTTICEILNDPICIKEIDSILAPSNSNTEKGSFLIAKAISEWSNNSFTPVMWLRNGAPDYWGMERIFIAIGNTSFLEHKYRENSIFLNIQSAGTEREYMSVPVSGVGWPPSRKGANGYSRISNAYQHAKWSTATTEHQNKVISNLLNYFNSKIKFSNDVSSVVELKPQLNTIFRLGKALEVNGYSHKCTNIAWSRYWFSFLVAGRWPENLSNTQLLEFLKISLEPPTNTRCLISNIRWYQRLNKQINWRDTDWDNIDPFIKDTLLNERFIRLESIKAISQTSTSFKKLYIQSLYENEDKLSFSAHIVEYIREHNADNPYKISESIEFAQIFDKNNKFSGIASVIRITNDILSGKLQPNTLLPNSIEHLITLSEKIQSKGSLCILKAMYQMNWHEDSLTKDYFPMSKKVNSGNVIRLKAVCPWGGNDKETDYYLITIKEMDMLFKTNYDLELYEINTELTNFNMDHDRIQDNLDKLRTTFNKLSLLDRSTLLKTYQVQIEDTLERIARISDQLNNEGTYVLKYIDRLNNIFNPCLSSEYTNTLKLLYDNQLDQYSAGWQLKAQLAMFNNIDNDTNIADYDLI